MPQLTSATLSQYRGLNYDDPFGLCPNWGKIITLACALASSLNDQLVNKVENNFTEWARGINAEAVKTSKDLVEDVEEARKFFAKVKPRSAPPLKDGGSAADNSSPAGESRTADESVQLRQMLRDLQMGTTPGASTGAGTGAATGATGAETPTPTPTPTPEPIEIPDFIVP